MEPACKLALEANFGSVEQWRDQFAAMGISAASDPGCVMLVFKPHQGTLVNFCSASPTGAQTGDVPILVLDMNQLASRNDPAVVHTHVDGFIANIDWDAAYQRYQHAVHEASEPFRALHDDAAQAVLLDVRRAGVFEKAETMLPGARWRDPAAVSQWAGELPAGSDVVVYCVYGHEVGRATALRLRAAGLNARYLEGGIDGWQSAGRPVAARAEG